MSSYLCYLLHLHYTATFVEIQTKIEKSYRKKRYLLEIKVYHISSELPPPKGRGLLAKKYIKKFGNDTRMGLMNYYQKNNNADDAEMVEQ